MQYITTPQMLKEATQEMAGEEILAIDLECENNLHHYGTYISLIQISSKKSDWVLDVLAVPDISFLLKIFDDKNIKKIFHDVSFDLRILHLQFGCRPKNVFDTQLGALLLGKTEIGLGPLLKSYYNVKKEHKYQIADWTKRPLSNDMLEYATKDTKHLLPLYFDIQKELKEKNRWEWALEECDHIEVSELIYKENVFSDFKGYKFLSEEEQAMLKNIFALREKVAKQVDMPNYFVLNNARIKELLAKPPLDLKTWKNLRAVHPIVRKNAKSFLEAVTIYDVSSLPKKKYYPRYTPAQKEKTFKLNTLAENVAKKLGIRKHLIMNKDQVHDIVLHERMTSLRNWQKKLLA